jgi:hypothetical protein
MPLNSIDLGYTERPDHDRMLAYQSSPWSAACRAQRGTNQDFSGVNYATFWFTVPALPPLVGFLSVNFTDPSNNYHSEKEVWINRVRIWAPYHMMSIPHWTTGQHPGYMGPRQTAANLLANFGCQITAVYTERQPCGACSPFLEDVLVAGVPVYWHFLWVSPNTSKYQRDDEDDGMLMLASLKRGVPMDEKKEIRRARVEGNNMLKKSLH